MVQDHVKSCMLHVVNMLACVRGVISKFIFEIVSSVFREWFRDVYDVTMEELPPCLLKNLLCISSSFTEWVIIMTSRLRPTHSIVLFQYTLNLSRPSHDPSLWMHSEKKLQWIRFWHFARTMKKKINLLPKKFINRSPPFDQHFCKSTHANCWNFILICHCHFLLYC